MKVPDDHHTKDVEEETNEGTQTQPLLDLDNLSLLPSRASSVRRRNLQGEKVKRKETDLADGQADQTPLFLLLQLFSLSLILVFSVIQLILGKQDERHNSYYA